MRRITDGEDVEAVFDEKQREDRCRFDRLLRNELNRPDLADKYQAKIREIDLVIYGARAIWTTLSVVQKRVLPFMAEAGARLGMMPKSRAYAIRTPLRTVVWNINRATVKTLAAHSLIDWEGDAFQPSSTAMLSDRGRFVLAHGPQKEPLV